jgi:glutaminyl-tRNA synthetase
MAPHNEKTDVGETPANFIRDAIIEDLKNGRFDKVVTRFPPEPNGHLHIGHAKALHIDYGMAQEFKGQFNLRFDDTNPSKEEDEYVQAIIEDVKWLGCDFGKHLYFASDYFEKMYAWAIMLIKAGKAYVCELTADQVREYRGTLTNPGRESPGRNRSTAENLELFERMRKGEFPEGSRTLRAKIDMASPNINLRDPVMYRIVNAPHHRQGSTWCIYPMYDWAHGLEDSIENITHSLCSLEYEDHRPLYDWFLDQLPVHHPRQIEFSRLNLTYTVMSKRKLLQLVQEKMVSGWDDPRLPTLSGLRRRGYTPDAIRLFAERIGVAKRGSIVDMAFLEFCLREVQNKCAPRFMGVLKPLKVVIENYPEGKCEDVDAVNNPENPSSGTRKIPFSGELYIERDDFMEEPPKKFFRLAPGREVRLRYAYFITCIGVVKDEKGEIKELRCTYDPATRGGDAPDGRSPKATMHWVSAKHAIDAEVRLYDRLFNKENPDDTPDGNFMANLNPGSLTVLSLCKLEPNLKDVKSGFRCQFERLGYFCVDPDSQPGKPVYNRSVTLRDEWAKIQERERLTKTQKIKK